MKKFAQYILLEWVLFYTYQIIEGSTKWNFEEANGEGLFLAAFMLLALPLVELVVFYYPFQLALKQKGRIAILLLSVTFGLEFIIGWYATSQNLELWMIVKIVLSAVLFGLIYRKQITL